jgi:hypothetical protein
MLSLFKGSKTVEVSFGEFHCPKCQRLSTYKHKEEVEKKRFLFISFLGAALSEYLECQACKTRYSLEILRTGVSSDARQILDAIKGKLESGVSLQEAEGQLLDSGIDAGSVKRYVSVAAGIAHRKCLRCELTYIASVHKCHKCGASLPV